MWWRRKQRDFNAEVEAHLQLEADELVSEGLSPSDAQAAARRAFGNRMSAQERFYESTHWMLWDHLVRDVRFAARVLTKDGNQDVFFPIEVEINRSIRDAGGFGDLRNLGVEVAVLREDVDSSAKDALTLARPAKGGGRRGWKGGSEGGAAAAHSM